MMTDMHDMNDTCYTGYENVGVTIEHVTHDEPFKMFWDWYKQTWLSLHDVEYDPTDDTCVQAAKAVVDRKALPTPMEVLAFDVKITGLSRVALAQITRGRIGHCYNVESQMPQHIRHAVTVPMNIAQHDEFGPRVAEIQRLVSELYDDMYDAGIPPQDCRYVTLHGQQTSLRWHVNFAALLGFFARRSENGLTDELNYVSRLFRRELRRMYLNDDGSEKIPGSGWSYLISKLDCMGGSRVCLNNDKVFGNTGRAPSAGSWVPSIVNDDNPCDYDFEKSALYLELLNMPDDLLFEGEREMIDEWRSTSFRERLLKLSK